MTSATEITYTIDQPIEVDQFIDVLRRSTLGLRRPIDDHECMAGMLSNTSLMICAWASELLVGIARSVTDFHYCCYLSDLAVSRECQGQGVGLALQQHTQAQLGPRCTVILLSAPAAVDYYPKIGYARCDRSFTIGSQEPLSSGER